MRQTSSANSSQCSCDLSSAAAATSQSFVALTDPPVRKQVIWCSERPSGATTSRSFNDAVTIPPCLCCGDELSSGVLTSPLIWTDELTSAPTATSSQERRRALFRRRALWCGDDCPAMSPPVQRRALLCCPATNALVPRRSLLSCLAMRPLVCRCALLCSDEPSCAA